MIAFVDGILEESQPFRVIINVQGVGYELNTPLSTTTQIGHIGERVRLHTQLVVREDSHQLFGFATLKEKSAFIALTEKVSGIGPKIALNILSRLSVDALRSAIASGNVTLLTQCPGIGKKTAERLVLELRDIFSKQPTNESGPTSGSAFVDTETGAPDVRNDAIAALITLGFKQVDAEKRIDKVLGTSAEVPAISSLIKKALAGS